MDKLLLLCDGVVVVVVALAIGTIIMVRSCGTNECNPRAIAGGAKLTRPPANEAATAAVATIESLLNGF